MPEAWRMFMGDDSLRKKVRITETGQSRSLAPAGPDNIPPKLLCELGDTAEEKKILE